MTRLNKTYLYSFVLSLLLLCTPYMAQGYGQSAYSYSEASYYSQPYYQGSYYGQAFYESSYISYAPANLPPTQVVTGSNFQPDLVWIKNRTTNYWNTITDIARGLTKDLFSNSNSAQTTTDTNGYVLNFNSNGFTGSAGASTGGNVNSINNNYIAWLWKKGVTQGVDVVTYTGTGVAHNVAHSLGATPAMYLTKRTDNLGNWVVYHKDLGNNVLLLNSSAGSTANSVYFGSAPSATNFTPSTGADVDANGATYVSYLFAETSGFSKISSYTGNGSSDGPFVYTEFKPKYILIKSTASADWYVWDTARNTYNPLTAELYPDLANAEGSATDIDSNFNGFKIRSANGAFNGSGVTYVYAAFADEPFKYTGIQGPSAYTISYSLRLRSEANAYLSRTYTSSATYTFSAWVRRGKIDTTQPILGSTIKFNSNNTLTAQGLTTSAIFRDPSAWMHIVVSNNGLYINGVNYGAVTTSAQSNVPIGTDGSSNYFDGYMSDVNFIDGAAVAATCFGEWDSYGYWHAKSYDTAVCGPYGTQGYHLQFAGGGINNNQLTTAPLWAATTYTLACTVPELPSGPQLATSTTIHINPARLTLSAHGVFDSINSILDSVTGFPYALVKQGQNGAIDWTTINAAANSCSISPNTVPTGANINNSAAGSRSIPAATLGSASTTATLTCTQVDSQNGTTVASSTRIAVIPTTCNNSASLSCTWACNFAAAGGAGSKVLPGGSTNPTLNWCCPAPYGGNSTYSEAGATVDGTPQATSGSIPANTSGNHSLVCTTSGSGATVSVASGAGQEFTQSELNSIALTATPARVRKGGTTVISWTTGSPDLLQNLPNSSCAVSGPGIPVGIANTKLNSSPPITINTPTQYTFTCTDGMGGTYSVSKTVGLIPQTQEI